jgi:excisionase family DNA binding protein
MDRWLNVTEAAAYTGFCADSVRDAAKAGQLQSSRKPSLKGQGHWRFKQEWLDQWLTSPRRRGPRRGRTGTAA